MAKNQAYYEAENKIEEALRSGTTKLDLSTFDNFRIVTSRKSDRCNNVA